jgi:copper chaperone CopZ
MKTVHCVRAVFQALAGVPGVTRAEVQVGQADIDVAGALSEEALARALDVVGYRLKGVRAAPRALPVIGDERLVD